MDKIIFFAGIASSFGGVFLLLYQGITYLSHNSWTNYSMLFLVDRCPGAIRDQIQGNPQIAGAFSSCPLYVFLIVFGLLLIFIGSRLGDRYVS